SLQTPPLEAEHALDESWVFQHVRSPGYVYVCPACMACCFNSIASALPYPKSSDRTASGVGARASADGQARCNGHGRLLLRLGSIQELVEHRVRLARPRQEPCLRIDPYRRNPVGARKLRDGPPLMGSQHELDEGRARG